MLKLRRVSYSCGCTAEDFEYEVFCTVAIAALTYEFGNAQLLRCVRLSKSTKMRQRTVVLIDTVILLISNV